MAACWVVLSEMEASVGSVGSVYSEVASITLARRLGVREEGHDVVEGPAQSERIRALVASDRVSHSWRVLSSSLDQVCCENLGDESD